MLIKRNSSTSTTSSADFNLVFSLNYLCCKSQIARIMSQLTPTKVLA
jgi:hypothetical protein